MTSQDPGTLLQGVLWWILLWPPTLWFIRHTYRATRPPVSAAQTRALQVLRASSLSLLVFLLMAPVLRYVQQYARFPAVVTLIDHSQSMAVREDGRSRHEVVVEALDAGLLELLGRGIVGSFAGSATRSAWDEVRDLPAAGHATDLASALDQATRWGAETGRLAAIVIISDGRHNLGDDPVAAARDVGVPIHALGVGSDTPPDDVQIADVAMAAALYAGHGSSLSLTIRQWGFSHRPLRVEVRTQDQIVASEDLTVSQTDTTLSIELPPLPAGLQTLTVTVPPSPGEVSRENNVERVLTLVRPHRLRLRAIAGAPSADFTFLRRALMADSSLSCEFSILTAARPASIGDLADVDVLVLHDLPRGNLRAGELDRLVTHIRRGGGLLWFGGARVATSGGWPVSDLPLLMPRSPLAPPSLPAQPAPDGQHHPSIRSAAGISAWARLPPLTGVPAAADVPIGGTVLLQVPNQPLAVAASLGLGRVISIAGSGFWRLDLLAQGAGETPNTIRRFWRQSVQWLGLPDAAKRIRSTPRDPVVRHGAPSQIAVEVFDELMQPFSGAELSLQLNGERMFPRVQRLGSGRYLAILQGLAPGEYTYELGAAAEGVELGRDDGHFVVAEQSIETIDQRQDHEMLRRVAEAGGGQYRPLEQWQQIADQLAPPSVLTNTERQIGMEVSDTWWLAVLVCLLSTEWALRRRWGLL